MTVRLPIVPPPPELWRSLEERAGAPHLSGEFPPGAEELEGASRRTFLQLLGATAALAGCSDPARDRETIVPYARRPDDVTPGVPAHYATAHVLDGLAIGLLVRSHEGRPTKVEGNPDHPASLGATGPIEQALVAQLYDPQRARSIVHRGTPRAWRALTRAIEERAPRWKDGGLRFLGAPTSSPLVAHLRDRIRARFPTARFHGFSAAKSDAPYAGARLAFGRALETHHDLSRAAVVLALDADFLCEGAAGLRLAREFAARRTALAGMNRLYAIESTLSVTGVAADHRLRARPSEVQGLAGSVAALLAQRGLEELAPIAAKAAPAPRPENSRWLAAVADDLLRHRGACAILAGPRQPPAVHALAQALNAALGGSAFHTAPILLDEENGPGALPALAGEMKAGAVDTLVVTAWNPVYAAPADLDFARQLDRVPLSIYAGLYQDETAAHASWFVPTTHLFESWGDARAPDGTVTFVQPLIEPLFGGVPEIDLLAAFAGGEAQEPRVRLREFWRGRSPGPDSFESTWERWLRTGLVPDTALPRETPAVQWAAIAAALSPVPPPSGLEIAFHADSKVHDGRFANISWLQELPDALTKLTWDNAALASPATAARLRLATGDVVELALAQRRVSAPILILPGHADDVVSVSLGYGRHGAESTARGVGFDAGALRRAEAPWFDVGLTITPQNRQHRLAITQRHWEMEGRPLAIQTTPARLEAAVAAQRGPVPSLHEPFEYTGYRWGMAVDLSRCTGCSACVVACQAENNIPVVGKEGVLRRREMHWLRIDRYFMGPPEEPEVITQPVACVHCEKAPCEYVCPVNATVHSDEGLNEMVYNRCIGTRYCSNNCPYKVRRFNYLEYNYGGRTPPVAKLRNNPEVTVRSRGVMEKCTYCVQRIERVRIDARTAGRPIRDGEVVTACAQVCPTQAITFGTLSDPAAAVTRLHHDPRRYDLLHELGTQPRTAYLARVKNPNPDLGPA